MSGIRRHRSLRKLSAFAALVVFALLSTVWTGPLSAQPLELPLGLATGSNEAEISVDGKKWDTLTAVSSLVFDKTMIRTRDSLAWVPLHDVTQFELHQCGVVGVYGSRAATVVKIAQSRALFRLPASSGTVFATPNVRFQIPASTATKRSGVLKVGGVGTPSPNSFDALGWIIVDGGMNNGERWRTRIEFLQGKLLAIPANGGGPQILEAGQIVDFMESPKEIDPDFKELRDKAFVAGPCLPTVAAFLLPVSAAAPTFGLGTLVTTGSVLGGGGAAIVGFGGGGGSSTPPASAFVP